MFSFLSVDAKSIETPLILAVLFAGAYFLYKMIVPQAAAATASDGTTTDPIAEFEQAKLLQSLLGTNVNTANTTSGVVNTAGNTATSAASGTSVTTSVTQTPATATSATQSTANPGTS